MSYVPPFIITSKILNLVASISEQLGRISAINDAELRLRRINRIKTIQGSLAIEGNTLSEEQITAVLEGKPVIAPAKEVQEVKNALALYECFDEINPYIEDDLLQSHSQLMLGLVDASGVYRAGGVGVMSGKEVVHMAPPANQVPRLMSELFEWLNATDQHPLIVSAVFHYEFEFIHPFVDGNGRIGRLWQSLILAKWNRLFVNFPVESLVFKHQTSYYKAIAESTYKTDSAPFIEWMLSLIDQVLGEHVKVGQQVTQQDTQQDTQQAFPQADVLEAYPELLGFCSTPRTRKEIQAFCGLKDRENFRIRVLNPLVASGLIKLTIPDKPKSPKQRYIS